MIDFDINFEIPPSICYSGGAKGADQLFGSLAQEFGHKVCHFSFLNHKYDNLCDPSTIIQLNSVQLAEAKSPLKEAAKLLGRTNGRYEYTQNLLQRNYWQIKYTDRVYAITTIDWENGGRPNGGTGWAIAMAYCKDPNPAVYVYDVNKLQWYKTVFKISQEAMDWEECVPPRPFGHYTGIGTRDLTKEGRAAIEGLYQ